VASPLVRAAKAAAGVGLLLLGAACAARPTGDFGRANPSWTHDEAMPAIGALKREHLDKKPVSSLNRTDEERLLHDRVWRYLTAPHARDWSFDASVEFQRTGMGATDHMFRTDRYYGTLSGTRYASSHTRFAKLADDISTDLQLLPPTVAAVCAVIEIDRRRGIAADGAVGIDAALRQQQHARRGENAETIGWFTRALRYRYESYELALNRLLVETPHEGARRVDGLLSQMLVAVEQAERGDICPAGGSGGSQGGSGIAARLLLDDELILRK
jgi:hypothetical protein